MKGDLMFKIILTIALLVLGIGYGIVLVAIKKAYKYASIVFIVTGAIGLLLNSFTIIPTGYTGVRVRFGNVSDTTLKSGVNFHFPIIDKVELINNKQQDMTLQATIWSETSDQTVVYYENPVITYQINAESSAWIVANINGGAGNLLTSELISSAIKTASKELATEDATSRSKIEPLSAEKLQSAVDSKYGEDVVSIISVVIQGADYEDSYNEAIAARQQAEIEAETQAIENQKAIDKAEADKQVALTEAEAEAEANRILSESVTDEVYQLRFLEKWDGSYPLVVGDSGVMLDISSLTGSE